MDEKVMSKKCQNSQFCRNRPCFQGEISKNSTFPLKSFLTPLREVRGAFSDLPGA